MIIIFSSSSFGNVGFYNLLPEFCFNEFQNLKKQSIGKFIICSNGVLNTFFYKYLIGRIFFVIYNKLTLFNNLKAKLFINFYINNILSKYTYYNFLVNFFKVNLNNIFIFGGVYIYDFFFVLVNKFIFTLFYRYFYGNIFFSIYFLNLWYVILLSRNSKYIFFVVEKRYFIFNNRNFF
ncbi:MAG: hypothetical protein HYZ30_01860 [Candidatus Azosocius agrarius]|nr:MAG: hypothetical protein HYZ30_01860 [Gammaproteobacteria bacterium]